MKERGILMNAAMVNATLREIDPKTQTRRALSVQPEEHIELATGRDGRHCADDFENKLIYFECPYGKIGDQLWVREHWSGEYIFRNTPPSKRTTFCDGYVRQHDNIWYWADGEPDHGDWEKGRPSIHMPRYASRILLEITDIRVERLNDISEEDAKAEGAEEYDVSGFSLDEIILLDAPLKIATMPYKNGFSMLWESINGPGSWAENPFVWVIEFKRIDNQVAP